MPRPSSSGMFLLRVSAFCSPLGLGAVNWFCFKGRGLTFFPSSTLLPGVSQEKEQEAEVALVRSLWVSLSKHEFLRWIFKSLATAQGSGREHGAPPAVESALGGHWSPMGLTGPPGLPGHQNESPLVWGSVSPHVASQPCAASPAPLHLGRGQPGSPYFPPPQMARQGPGPHFIDMGTDSEVACLTYRWTGL